jgi:hypothetical protein
MKNPDAEKRTVVLRGLCGITELNALAGTRGSDTALRRVHQSSAARPITRTRALVFVTRHGDDRLLRKQSERPFQNHGRRMSSTFVEMQPR